MDNRHLQIATEAAYAAGAAIMELYGGEHSASPKADGTPVTEADIVAHKIIARALGETGIPVLSEEGEDFGDRAASDRVWIIDPLDGTRDFIEKTGDFVVMIGLAEQGAPVAGVVYAPVYDTLYHGVVGDVGVPTEGAYVVRKGIEERIWTSDVQMLVEARVMVSRSHFTPEIQKRLSIFQTDNIHRAGSNGIKIGRIAEGAADAFFNPTGKMGEWDLCAPHAILQAAGGTFTDMDGNPIVYNKPEPEIPHGVAATNGHLHGQLIEHLAQGK